MSDEPPPKVFISYSWTSDAHVEWVEELATRLRADGVDVMFDRWDLKRGHDKNAFMESMVTDSNMAKVLVICDSLYAEKADGKKGGVGTESQIISPHIYAKAKQEKFIALTREAGPDGTPFLPTFLAHTIYLDFTNEERFEETYDDLIRDIYNAPAKNKPPLGKRPAHLTAPSPVHVRTASTFLRFKNAVEQGRSIAPALLDEYFEVFIESLDDFRIVSTTENLQTFDEVVLESIEKIRSYRDNFVECIQVALKFAPGAATEQSILDFLEKLIPFQSCPEEVNSHRDIDFDNYKFFSWELFLYLIATCIRTKQYAMAKVLMEHPYHVVNPRVGNGHYESSMVEFNKSIGSFETIRRKRLDLRLISVAASILKERAPTGPISFKEILQADCLLFLRGFLPITTSYGVWTPLCLPYAEYCGAADLFARATTDRGFETLKTVLNARDRVSLMEAIDNAIAYGSKSLQFHARFVLLQYLNYAELNRLSGRKVEGP